MAGCALALSRLPRFADRPTPLVVASAALAAIAFTWHSQVLLRLVFVPHGLQLSIGNSVSLVGIQLALIAILCMLVRQLHGLAGGFLVLAGFTAAGTGLGSAADVDHGWQLTAHILVSMFAYGLLAVGAIVAIFARIQDRRLRQRQLSSVNALFTPLETTESLLFGITAAGFLTLLIGVLSGLLFVDNLFAQHLVHKTVLSLLALVMFGVLLVGRRFAGWRGRTAISLYLWSFAVLCLAYFGSRVVLESVLGRSWG